MGQKKQEGPTFEEAIGRLEALVRELEMADLPLDRALALFQEGVELSRGCAAMLDEAERKIERLAQGEGGSRLEPLEIKEEGA